MYFIEIFCGYILDLNYDMIVGWNEWIGDMNLKILFYLYFRVSFEYRGI